MPRTALALAMLASLTFATPAVAGETIVLLGDSYCPYTCEPGPLPGYTIEIATKVFAAKGITVEYKMVDWQGAIADARAGKVAGLAGGIKTDAPDLVYPDMEVGISKSFFVVRRGDAWRWSGPASLAGRRLALVASYTYAPEIEAFAKANAALVTRAEGTDPFAANARALLTQKTDALFEDGAVVAFNAMRMKIGELIERIPGPGEADKLYVSFSPKHPKAKELAKIFSEGVAALRKSGELATILKRYGVTDWR